MVNDASSDNSLALARSWEHRHPELIQVIDSGFSEPQGIISSYQTGVSAASEPYLAFLEQDDAWGWNYLETKSSIFAADNACQIGVIFSPYRVIRDRFYGFDMVVRQFLLTSLIPKNRAFDNFSNLLQFNNVTTFSAFVCRRDLWEKIPQPLDSGCLYFDWWVLAHLSLHSRFCLDRKSEIKWRCSHETTLGSQSFSSHQQQLSSFFRCLYKSLALALDEPGCSQVLASHRQIFYRKQAALNAQLNLLNSCTPETVLAAIAKAPVQSLGMLASILVNRLKKSND